MFLKRFVREISFVSLCVTPARVLQVFLTGCIRRSAPSMVDRTEHVSYGDVTQAKIKQADVS